MKQQTIEWATELLEACLKAMGSTKEESAMQETDVRYFHELDNLDFESDIDEILSMSDNEIDAELAAMGITDDDIDEKLAVLTNDDIVRLPQSKHRKNRDASTLLPNHSKTDHQVYTDSASLSPLSEFEDKLLSTLIKQAIEEQIGIVRGPAYSTKAAGLKTQEPDTTKDNVLPFSKKAETDKLEVAPSTETLEISASGRKATSKNQLLQFGKAASITMVCATAIIASHIMSTKPDNNKSSQEDAGRLAIVQSDGSNPQAVKLVEAEETAVIKNQNTEDKVANLWITENSYIPVIDSETGAINRFSAIDETESTHVDSITYLQENTFIKTGKRIGLGNRYALPGSSTLSYAVRPQMIPIASEPVLQFDTTMVFLDRISSGEIEATEVERLKILRKLLEVAKSDALQAELSGKGYQSSNTCPSKGVYEHPVSRGDSLSGIILDECLYKLPDSTLFRSKTKLSIGDIVVMNIGENRVVNKVYISREDGSTSKIYDTAIP